MLLEGDGAAAAAAVISSFRLREKLLLLLLLVGGGGAWGFNMCWLQVLFADVADSADDDELDVVTTRFMGGVLFLMADIFLFFVLKESKNNHKLNTFHSNDWSLEIVVVNV